MMNRVGYGLAVVTLVTSSSCSLIRRGQGKTPPPVIAAPPTKPSLPVENPQVPPPPKVQQAEAPKIAPPVATQIPAKPPEPKPVRNAVRKKPKPPTKTQPAAAIVAQTPVPVSQEPISVLAPVLSASEQETLNRAIDAAVQQAENNLAAVAAKPPLPQASSLQGGGDQLGHQTVHAPGVRLSTGAQLLGQGGRQLAGKRHQAGGGIQLALLLAVKRCNTAAAKAARRGRARALPLDLAFQLAYEVGLFHAHGLIYFGRQGRALSATPGAGGLRLTQCPRRQQHRVSPEAGAKPLPSPS